MKIRPMFAAAAALGAAVCTGGPAAAYPSGLTIRVIYPFTAGGSGGDLAQIGRARAARHGQHERA